MCLQNFVDENYIGTQIIKVIFIETPISEKYFITIGVDQDYQVLQNDTKLETDNLNQERREITKNVILEFDSNCEFVGLQQ